MVISVIAGFWSVIVQLYGRYAGADDLRIKVVTGERQCLLRDLGGYGIACHVIADEAGGQKADDQQQNYGDQDIQFLAVPGEEGELTCS